ncbi:MAG: serine hydrolase [Bacteroidota bacterium]
MKSMCVWLLITLCGGWGLQGQQLGLQSLEQLEESPAGSRLVSLIRLLNSGEKIEKAHVENLFSKRIIKKNSLKRLRNLMLDIRETDGQLQLYDAERVEMFRYETILWGMKQQEWLALNLDMEDDKPYKIDGLSLRNVEQMAQAESPMLSPETIRDFEVRSREFASHKEVIQKTQKIAEAYEQLGWFSGVILLAKDGQPFFEQAYGLANIEKNIPNTMATKFRIGSINKSYTATLILQMVEQGKLSVDDKLSKFELGFPQKVGDKIELTHILTHTAGFSDIFIPKYINNIRDYKDIDDILPLLRDEPLMYEPGTDQAYSNYGYIVLGAILEKVSGKPFKELIEQNIFNRLGTTTTHYDIAENIEGEANSYRFGIDGKKVDHTAFLEYCTPDGGMYATAADILQYYQAFFYSETLLKNETKAFRASGYRSKNGNWNDIIQNAGGAIGEAGGGPGVSAVIEMLLKDNYAVIVLANTDEMVTEQVARRIMSAIEGNPYPEAKLPISHHLYKVMEEKGIEELEKNFASIIEDYSERRVHSQYLNSLGYALMQEKNLEEAIEVFHVNTRLFPDEANPYDSLGEAYFHNGDTINAKKYYQLALQKDPDLASALRMIKELE